MLGLQNMAIIEDVKSKSSQEIGLFLAIEVMKWKLSNDAKFWVGQKNERLYTSSWDPCSIHRQALELANTLDLRDSDMKAMGVPNLTISKNGKIYTASFIHGKWESENVCDAISRAAVLALMTIKSKKYESGKSS